MPDVLTGHIGELAAVWLVLMAVVGGVTTLVMIRMPGRRHQIPLLVPLVIGVFGLTATGVGAARSGWDAVGHALTGAPVARDLPGIGGSVALLVVGGVAVAVLGCWASFRLEVALLRLRLRRRELKLGLPGGLGMPSRQESMDGVARVARRPVVFGMVSLIGAAGEEAFFRGLMLGLAWTGTPDLGQLSVLIAAQAVLFALLHIAFGWRTVVAKTLLGVALAVGALTAGVIIGALLPHLLFQARVLAQFRPRGSAPDRKVSHE